MVSLGFVFLYICGLLVLSTEAASVAGGSANNSVGSFDTIGDGTVQQTGVGSSGATTADNVYNLKDGTYFLGNTGNRGSC